METKLKPARWLQKNRARPVVAVTMPKDLLDALDAHTENRGLSRSQAVVEAIRAYLKRRKAAVVARG